MRIIDFVKEAAIKDIHQHLKHLQGLSNAEDIEKSKEFKHRSDAIQIVLDFLSKELTAHHLITPIKQLPLDDLKHFRDSLTKSIEEIESEDEIEVYGVSENDFGVTKWRATPEEAISDFKEKAAELEPEYIMGGECLRIKTRKVYASQFESVVCAK